MEKPPTVNGNMIFKLYTITTLSRTIKIWNRRKMMNELITWVFSFPTHLSFSTTFLWVFIMKCITKAKNKSRNHAKTHFVCGYISIFSFRCTNIKFLKHTTETNIWEYFESQINFSMAFRFRNDIKFQFGQSLHRDKYCIFERIY